MGGPTILHVFPTFAVGGSQVRMADIATHFGGRWRHLVMALDGARGCAERIGAGAGVTFVEPPRPAGFLTRRARLAELGPDLLATYNWGAMDWAAANFPHRFPHLHVEDGFGPDEAKRPKRRRVLARRLLLGRSMVAVPSHTLARVAVEDWRLSPAQVCHIPNGIDCARFPSPPGAELSALLPPDSARPVIGAVCGLRREKRLDRLIRAFALVRRRHLARLAIIGDGPERAPLEALAAQSGAGADIVFTGHLAEPGRAYSLFQVLALSSDTEQMPISVLEGMAAGLPVAATDVGDVALMVAPGNLAFLTPRDEDPLAEALAALVADAALRAELGCANRRRAAERFDRAPMLAAWGNLFDSLIMGGHR